MGAVLHTMVALGVFTTFPAQGNKTDQELFQGTWKTTSLIVSGKEVPAESYRDEVVTVSGNVRQLKKGEKQLAKATFVLNPSTNPKSIDFTFTEGDLKGVTQKGIYKFEGDHLIINMDLGQERPSDFTCEVNSSRSLQKIKRVAER